MLFGKKKKVGGNHPVPKKLYTGEKQMQGKCLGLGTYLGASHIQSTQKSARAMIVATILEVRKLRFKEMKYIYSGNVY